ncbi:LysR family transcriptional regulator [Sphaerimonospora cavernae]|uniref:LysR family transcriptional regulator n=1 Tax=Sphaerimonospora cavernae TaxID=1740611 RepID=A0ABV6UB95_9ACTN
MTTYDLALYQLRTYREVARLGSFTKAARSLGYAQSSVTSHIRTIETQVGTQLVRRLPHGVRLTAAGEIFHEYVSRIFGVLDEMSGALDPSGEKKGRVVVGASSLLMEQRVGALIRECRYRHPKLDVSPRQMVIGDLIDAVRNGEVDLALIHSESWARPPESSGVVVESLQPIEVVPVGSTALAQAEDKERALRNVRVLAIDPACPSHQDLALELRERYGMEPTVIECGSVGSARELVRSGYGIALLPAGSMHGEGSDSGLAVLDWFPRMRLAVWALWAGTELTAPRVRVVCELAARLTGETATV